MKTKTVLTKKETVRVHRRRMAALGVHLSRAQLKEIEEHLEPAEKPCSICGKPYHAICGIGNNPWPVKSLDEGDCAYVSPARMKRAVDTENAEDTFGLN